MLIEYLLYRLTSLFYGPIQLFNDLSDEMGHGGYFIGSPNPSPLDYSNVVDGVASFGRLLSLEIPIILFVLLISMVVSLLAKKEGGFLKTALSFCGRMAFILGLLGLISRCFGLIDYYKYMHAYSSIYSYRAYVVGIVRDLFWIFIGRFAINQIIERLSKGNAVAENDPLLHGKEQVCIDSSLEKGTESSTEGIIVQEDYSTSSKAAINEEMPSAPNFCYKCGAKLQEDSLFCWKCGSKVQ